MKSEIIAQFLAENCPLFHLLQVYASVLLSVLGVDSKQTVSVLMKWAAEIEWNDLWDGI